MKSELRAWFRAWRGGRTVAKAMVLLPRQDSGLTIYMQVDHWFDNGGDYLVFGEVKLFWRPLPLRQSKGRRKNGYLTTRSI